MHRSHGIPGLLGGYEAQAKMKRHLAVLLLAGLSFLQLVFSRCNEPVGLIEAVTESDSIW